METYEKYKMLTYLANAMSDRRFLRDNLARIVDWHGGFGYRLFSADLLTQKEEEEGADAETVFRRNKREGLLRGEAYLEVAKDSLHPFRIETEKAHVIVLGTKLNIRCYDDEPCMSVTLETGRADLLTANQRQSLPVGHKAVIDSKGNIAVSPADLYVETAWHQGRLAFDNQPMERIMHDLERWYGVQASFSSDEARKARFTLDLDRYDTFNSFMDVVRMIGEVDIALENKNQVLISKK